MIKVFAAVMPPAAISSLTTEARRSLPDEQCGFVITAVNPQRLDCSPRAGLSVQSLMAVGDSALAQRSSTCRTIGLPLMSAISLPGRRLDSSLAGIARTMEKGPWPRGWAGNVSCRMEQGSGP